MADSPETQAVRPPSRNDATVAVLFGVIVLGATAGVVSLATGAIEI